MVAEKNFKNITFSRLRDFADFPLPEKMEEIVYVANATNFRRFIFNKFGKDDIDIDHEIATNPDTKMTYLGYRRFLESDLKHIFPLGNGRTSNGYKRDVKYLAKQMLIRGYVSTLIKPESSTDTISPQAFAGVVTHAFPNYLRLSIHQSTGEHKISMSLLNTKTGYTTPWHCCIALMMDGEWISAPMGEFQKNPKMKLMYESGRPSYFQEMAYDVNVASPQILETAASSTDMLEISNAQPDSVMSSHASRIDAVHEKLQVVTEAASLGGVKVEDGLPNPFLGAVDPQLDPNSDSFSIKAWLKAVTDFSSREPEKYPRGVAGVAYRDLSAHGIGSSTDYQKTIGNYALELHRWARKLMGRQSQTRIQILEGFDGFVRSGEMLVVLGRPGSGCSTFLKTVAGETRGFQVGDGSYINYQGISPAMMHTQFRGECIYQAEVDAHFPQLTVGQTLDFAARARTPRNLPPGVTQDMYATHIRDVAMAAFGLSHARDTIVGSDLVRGVSGGERKRVSIAEVAIGGSTLQCWDNSTRGLDSSTALEFVRTLRSSTSLTGATALVTVYQASQSIYDVFDKVTLLYEGRQIYFGHVHSAKRFFQELGFECAPRQVIADFLTSLTNPLERRVRPGFEGKTPVTPDDFAAVWRRSAERARLLQEIEDFDKQYPIDGPSLQSFRSARRAVQAKAQRPRSPYTLSITQQVALCVRRGFQRLRGDMGNVIAGAFFNAIMALVIGSIFYNLPNTTGSLYSRGALLFFAILLASFASALEVSAIPCIDIEFD